jgi:hypothetical protein
MSKKPRPKYGQYQPPRVSLAPLNPEDALRALLETPPPPKNKKEPAPEKESQPEKTTPAADD